MLTAQELAQKIFDLAKAEDVTAMCLLEAVALVANSFLAPADDAGPAPMLPTPIPDVSPPS